MCSKPPREGNLRGKPRGRTLCLSCHPEQSEGFLSEEIQPMRAESFCLSAQKDEWAYLKPVGNES